MFPLPPWPGSGCLEATSRTDGQMDKQNCPPVFYRISSPIGSAALPIFSFSATAYGRVRVPLTS